MKLEFVKMEEPMRVEERVTSGTIDMSDKWWILDNSARLFRLTQALNSRSHINTTCHWLTPSGEDYNNLQIFYKKYEYHVVNPRDIAERAYIRKKYVMEVCKDIERTFFYGIRQSPDLRVIRNVDVPLVRTMGGLDYFISKFNYIHKITTIEQFKEIVHGIAQRCFDISPTYEPMCFVSREFLKRIIDTVYPLPEVTAPSTYGIPIFFYEGHNELISIDHGRKDNWKVNFIADTFVKEGDIFVVRLEDLVYRYLQNRNLHIEWWDEYPDPSTDEQPPPMCPAGDAVVCECALEVHNAHNMFKLIER